MLVLEDEPIVALDIECSLSDAGYDVTATFSTNATAMDWLTANTPDMVVLDIGLSDGSSVEVAHRLVAGAIPFIVFTGISASDASVDPVFHAGKWLEKPAPPNRIVEVVQSMLPIDVGCDIGPSPSAVQNVS
ncbi:response regulator [Bosea sp. BIWAKO-01]|uniref:response regulator n=1 Tax=Bosea sp. BIWAKO-01 TaxID=506668 RepID=UPI00159F0D31|nr:response regulator [Bosea sp. BIWAKO-01]